jgi:hypothetical protein
VPIRENLRAIAYMAKYDPLAILGFVLVGVFAVLFFHIQKKMKGIGYRPHYFGALLYDGKLPAEYLKVRKQHQWSPWPAYLVWPSLALGIFALVVGLFWLSD